MENMVYVSYKAKKGGDGSKEKPFQNIEQAIEELKKGITMQP